MTPGRWVRRAIGPILAVAALVVLAVAPAQALPTRARATAFPPFSPTRVLALGDSVMKGAEGQIPAALEGVITARNAPDEALAAALAEVEEGEAERRGRA